MAVLGVLNLVLRSPTAWVSVSLEPENCHVLVFKNFKVVKAHTISASS